MLDRMRNSRADRLRTQTTGAAHVKDVSTALSTDLTQPLCLPWTHGAKATKNIG